MNKSTDDEVQSSINVHLTFIAVKRYLCMS